MGMKVRLGLFIFLIWAGLAQGQTVSLQTRVGTPLPASVQNGSNHNWGIWVKNTDTQRSFNLPVSVNFRIEERSHSLGTWNLSTPLAPGDSIFLSGQISLGLADFPGPGPRESFWCVTSGNSECFSSDKSPITLVFPQGQPSQWIGLNLRVAIPDTLGTQASLNLAFSAINDDPAGTLFLPVSFLMSIDGQSPFLVASQLSPGLPLAPGDSFLFDLPTLPLSNLVAGGGGITHDIIVWPMRTGFFQPSDSVRIHFLVYDPLPASNSETSPASGQGPASQLSISVQADQEPDAPQTLQPVAPAQINAEQQPEEQLTPQSLSVQVWPNPFQQHISLSGTFVSGRLRIALFDQFGTQHYQQLLQLNGSESQVELSFQSLSPNLYWLLIEQGENRHWQLLRKE